MAQLGGDMADDREERKWIGPAILAGSAGLLLWRSFIPKTKDKIWGFLDAVAE